MWLLVLESPSDILVTFPGCMVDITNLLNFRCYRISSLVLLGHHPPQQPCHGSIGCKVSEGERVAQHIPGCRLGTVQLGTKNGATVTNTDLHGVGNGSLGLAGHIDGRP